MIDPVCAQAQTSWPEGAVQARFGTGLWLFGGRDQASRPEDVVTLSLILMLTVTVNITVTVTVTVIVTITLTLTLT